MKKDKWFQVCEQGWELDLEADPYVVHAEIIKKARWIARIRVRRHLVAMESVEITHQVVEIMDFEDSRADSDEIRMKALCLQKLDEFFERDRNGIDDVLELIRDVGEHLQ